MSEALKQNSSEQTTFVLNERDILGTLGKFTKSMSRDEITRFEKIYASRDSSTKSMLASMPKTLVDSKQIQV